MNVSLLRRVLFHPQLCLKNGFPFSKTANILHLMIVMRHPLYFVARPGLWDAPQRFVSNQVMFFFAGRLICTVKMLLY